MLFFSATTSVAISTLQLETAIFMPIGVSTASVLVKERHRSVCAENCTIMPINLGIYCRLHAIVRTY